MSVNDNLKNLLRHIKQKRMLRLVREAQPRKDELDLSQSWVDKFGVWCLQIVGRKPVNTTRAGRRYQRCMLVVHAILLFLGN